MSQTVNATMNIDLTRLRQAAENLGMVVGTDAYVTLYGGSTQKCDLVVRPVHSHYSMGFNTTGEVVYDHMITESLGNLMAEYHSQEVNRRTHGKFKVTNKTRKGTKLRLEIIR